MQVTTIGLDIAKNVFQVQPAAQHLVRSAWVVIHTLLKRGPAPPPVYQGLYDPKALFDALKVCVFP